MTAFILGSRLREGQEDFPLCYSFWRSVAKEIEHPIPCAFFSFLQDKGRITQRRWKPAVVHLGEDGEDRRG